MPRIACAVEWSAGCGRPFGQTSRIFVCSLVAHTCRRRQTVGTPNAAAHDLGHGQDALLCAHIVVLHTNCRLHECDRVLLLPSRSRQVSQRTKEACRPNCRLLAGAQTGTDMFLWASSLGKHGICSLQVVGFWHGSRAGLKSRAVAPSLGSGTTAR